MLNTDSVELKTFHDVTPIYLPKKTDLWCALLTDNTNIRLGYILKIYVILFTVIYNMMF